MDVAPQPDPLFPRLVVLSLDHPQPQQPANPFAAQPAHFPVHPPNSAPATPLPTTKTPTRTPTTFTTIRMRIWRGMRMRNRWSGLFTGTPEIVDINKQLFDSVVDF